jgi:ATP-dependent Clp protease adaptor protein ClpS
MSEKTLVKEQIEVKVKKPKRYMVLMHNDDYTTMEFVIEVLVEFFNKSAPEATKVMLDVHKKGAGIAGIYPYDIAVTKINQVHNKSRKTGFPLKLSLKEE